MCLSKPRINNMLFWWRTPMLLKISWFWETKSRLSPLFNLFKAFLLQLATVSKLALWLSLVKTSAVKVPFLDQHRIEDGTSTMTSQNLLWSDNQAACLYLRTLINRVDLSVTVSKWFRQLHVPSFIHFRSLGLCLGHSFSWRVKVVKCQGGQVSRTGFRDIGSTGSPKKRST